VDKYIVFLYEHMYNYEQIHAEYHLCSGSNVLIFHIPIHARTLFDIGKPQDFFLYFFNILHESKFFVLYPVIDVIVRIELISRSSRH